MNEWNIDDQGNLILNKHPQIIDIVNALNLKSINIQHSILRKISIKNCPNLKWVRLSNNNEVDLNLKIIFNSNDSDIFFIEIKNCTLESLSFSKVKVKTLSIIDTSIRNTIFGSSNLKNINFSTQNGVNRDFNKFTVKSSIITNIKINNINFEYIKIKNIKYNRFDLSIAKINNFEIDGLQGTKSLIIRKTEEDQKLYDNSKIFLSKIDFNGTFKISNFLPHENDNLYKLFIDNVVFNDYSFIKFNNSSASKISVYIEIGIITCHNGINIASNDNKDNLVTLMKIKYSTLCEGIINIENVNIANVLLTGYNVKLSTSFKNCMLHSLNFNDFDNKCILKFTNSTNFNNLSIRNSDLNDVIFRPLNPAKIEIKSDSFLGGMKIYGSDAINLDSTDLSSENKQEFYRQLKQAAKNSNNKFLELEYKAKEMAHYKSRSYDKVTHWFNGLSDHGVNWFKPFIYIVYWNVVIWLLLSYNLYTSYFVINLQKGYSLCEILLDLSFGFWIVLNPVSRMSEFSAYIEYYKPVHTFVPFLFFSAKILNGILIYQMISAFRKWVGKD